MCVKAPRAWMSGSESGAFVFHINHSIVWPTPLQSLCLLSGHSVVQIQWVYWVVRQRISMHWSSLFCSNEGFEYRIKAKRKHLAVYTLLDELRLPGYVAVLSSKFYLLIQNHMYLKMAKIKYTSTYTDLWDEHKIERETERKYISIL